MAVELITYFPHVMKEKTVQRYNSLIDASVKTGLSYHFLYNCLNCDNKNNFAKYFRIKRVDNEGNILPPNRKNVKMVRGSRNEKYRLARMQVEQMQKPMYTNFNDKKMNPSLRDNVEDYEVETNSLLNLKKRMLQSLSSEAAYS